MNKVARLITEAPNLNVVPSPIEGILESLDGHSLAEQDRAALMTRVDDKFVIHSHHLNALLLYVKDKYSVLTQHSCRVFDYETSYYDTLNYLFYHHHHAGKANRMKVRIRKYVQADMNFLEIKQKDNKGITHKHRHRIFQNHEKLYINDNVLANASNEPLFPALQVNYQRITLMHKTLNQRVTLDLNLKFFDLKSTNEYDLSNIIIIEIKRDRNDKILSRSELHEFLYKIGYQSTTFSKYCMGCVLTKIESLKTNNFKPNVLSLIKLTSR